jgi:Leucine-rich repeat (LRR) protein
MKKALIFACLLVFVSAVTASAGWDEEKGKVAIETLGGKLQWGEGKYAKNVISVDLSDTAVTDGDLRHLLNFKQLQNLDIRGTKVGDGGTQYIGFLKNLRTLNMFRTDLTDAGLARLRELDDLETLLIGGTKVTDEGLKNIESFSKLKKLSVFRTEVSDASLKSLGKLASLEVLLIGESRVTEEGAKKVLPKVRFTEQT